MITVNNLSKKLDDKLILDNINLSISKGSVYGMVGKNGSGKTTLINCMTGIYKTPNDSILIMGESPYDNPQLKQNIAYVPDTYPFPVNLRSREILYRFMESYSNFDKSKYSSILKRFDLDDSKPARNMSKGMKTQLMLALKLSTNPKILFLDEPTGGLDPLNQKIFFEILVDLLADLNPTVFIASHYIEGVEKICDRIGILDNGAIIFEDDIDTIKTNNFKYHTEFADVITDIMRSGSDE